MSADETNGVTEREGRSTWQGSKRKDNHVAGTNNSQEKHVNVPGSQSSWLGSNLAASGLVEHVTAESLACLEHVTAPLEQPDSSPIVPPGTHNLLPPRRLVCTYSCWTRDKTQPPITYCPCYPTPSTPTLIFATRSSFERAVRLRRHTSRTWKTSSSARARPPSDTPAMIHPSSCFRKCPGTSCRTTNTPATSLYQTCAQCYHLNSKPVRKRRLKPPLRHDVRQCRPRAFRRLILDTMLDI